MMLTMTATVKAIDSQRWSCRIQPFQLNREEHVFVADLLIDPSF
jgi:hypothetical protein